MSATRAPALAALVAALTLGCSGEVVLQDGPAPGTSAPTSTARGACDGAAMAPAEVCPLVPTDRSYASAVAIAAQARTILTAARDRMIVKCNDLADALGVARAPAGGEPSAKAACEPARAALEARVRGHIIEKVQATVVACEPSPLATCGAPVSEARAPTVGCPDVPITLDVPPGYEADAAILRARLPALESAFVDTRSATVLYTDVASRIGSPPSALVSPELDCAVGIVTGVNGVVVRVNEDVNGAMLGIWQTLGR